MADRQTGRLVHRGSGVTVYLFDGDIIAADSDRDAEAVIALLRAEPLVLKFVLDHAEAAIAGGADWLPTLNNAIDAPPLEAALVERFKQNLASFVAAQGPLEVERDRTGIPTNLQQGVDTSDIVGEPPPRPREAAKKSMTPPPVPHALRGAAPRIQPSPVVSLPPPPAPPVAHRLLWSPTTFAMIVLPLGLVVLFGGSLVLNALNGPRVDLGGPPVSSPVVAPRVTLPPPIAPQAPNEGGPPILVDPPIAEPVVPPAPPSAAPVVAPSAVKPPAAKPPPVKVVKAPVPDLPASHFLGEWRGTVSGKTSAVIVQVGEGHGLSGVFWTSDDSGRHDLPVTGVIIGDTVTFVGSGIELEMKVEGWQLVGRCTAPGDVSSSACLLVKK